MPLGEGFSFNKEEVKFEDGMVILLVPDRKLLNHLQLMFGTVHVSPEILKQLEAQESFHERQQDDSQSD